MMLKQRIGTPSLIVCLDRYTLSLLHLHQNPSTHSTFSAAVAITTPCGSQRPCAGSLAAISRYPTLAHSVPSHAQLIEPSAQVTILKEGVHSGSSSGVVPSSFRIVRQLLSRIEDEESGR